ncbi:MAG: Coenzyme F420 hydrogenase/dehydrogenase, beta subunit C-terminal domain [Bacteroidetes bacterium]|nr:Coenzyme F420 hydrogenase/dehydrogenase, beta subunit C-terminal domain [Bacteroidota bacterium]MBU1580845.1 Coenzyme F420 hydrogenase/dehydrogenase, beta subunit C-terminal domain [Bacteroidota bacterium]MBU2558395.1 Coenzyme F420 hydrogenase/dehydrogenase, beta subunit C-terminal domain [Bacteroidota bacterium]
MKSIDQLQSVMRSHLCNRCGSCVGLSEGKIVFGDKTGKYQPKIIAPIDEQLADTLWEACPGKQFDFPKYRKQFFREPAYFHEFIGPYERIGIGYAADSQVRREGASGGIISAILIWLLKQNKIDGAVVLGMSTKEPWLTQAFIATTPDEILCAAQSKYIISSNNDILPEIAAFKGRLAYVGLPGQIQSIRKLQAAKHPSVSNIDYIFGPFYGNTLHFSSINSFLRTHGEHDYHTITKLYFRYGEWPGNMRVELKSGRIIELKKFHANYLIPFHILRNSLYCTDLTSEFTDISGGDAWAPVYEERGKGFSMVISRSKKGDALLKEMVEAGWLSFDQISEQEAISMHSHGYDFKKRGGFIRIKFRKLLGKSVPDYGYQIKGFKASRYLMEMVISSLFIVMSTSFARWAVEQFPPKFIGGIFEKTRTIWKKSTHKIKRREL